MHSVPPLVVHRGRLARAANTLAFRAEQAPGGILWVAVVPLAMRILATSDNFGAGSRSRRRRRPLERTRNPGA
jgi:hypothetical protein